jgi:hypothetical protein
MKNAPLLLTFLLFSINMVAQTTRIALVKPNGTTTIHSTFQAAYDAASNDDYIYLPGGTFSLPTLEKKLHIIGAGSNLDSCLVTGTTKVSTFTISNGAQGGSVEGLRFLPGNGIIFSSNSNPSISYGFSIKRCFLDGNISTYTQWESLIIENNYFLSIIGGIDNSIIRNNIIMGYCNVGFSFFKNNVFFFAGNIQLGSSNTLSNNIFQADTYTAVPNSYFYNNVNITSNSSSSEAYNTITETWDEIFYNPGTLNPLYYSYDVHNNYHIKSTSACHNSGTDGTDRGIYGGSTPWVEGSIPSNPHIYFKQVAEETNAAGQLQIQFKVRTGN